MIKSETITFRISTEEKVKVEEIARENDRKLSYLMQQIVKQYLESQKRG